MISPTINNGTTRPVDALASNAKAIKVTLRIVMPLIPAFESPTIKAAVIANAHAVIEMSKVDATDKKKVLKNLS